MICTDDHFKQEVSTVGNARPPGQVIAGDLDATPENRQGRLQSLPDTYNNSSKGRISTLPAELLVEIFRWCTPRCQEFDPVPDLQPLRLAQVCRPWRLLALETSSLWTYAKLELTDNSMDSLCSLIGLWLKRGIAHPLLVDVHYREPTISGRYSRDSILSVVHSMMDHATGQALAFEGLGPTVSIDAASGSSEAPLVRERYSWSSTTQSNRNGSWKKHIHIQVWRVTSVVYGLEGQMDLGLFLVHLNLQNHPDLLKLSVDEGLIILSMFPLLEYLALTIGSSPSEDLVPIVYVMARLTSLRLSWVEPVDVGCMIDAMHTPVLKHLELDGPIPASRTAPIRGWDHLAALLRRSKPPLLTLHLSRMDCNGMDLAECLNLCPILHV